MAGVKALGAILVAALVVVGGVVAYFGFLSSPGQGGCVVLEGGTFEKGTVTSTTFGPVTEFALPGNDTWPSAIAGAPDGSMWFAEQAIPGVAHLYPGNGTLVQYAWPGYKAPSQANCFPTALSAGIALWNGRVWSADQFGNMLFGLRPGDGSTESINVTGRANYPYWLAAGPDGNLWVSFDDTPAKLARISPNLTMSVINLEGLGEDNPLQIDFVNSSLAFLSTINLSTNSTTGGCVCDGRIYSFDPSRVNSTLAPAVVGGGYDLIEPTSVSYSQGRIWVAQHYASSVVSYDFSSRTWTKYPTSLVGWTNTTLPLLIAANGSRVWFNEHYANKIALINPAAGTMTEISESNPPASTNDGIQNDEYIAVSGGRLWFTSMSGNYVGYVDGSYVPPFGLEASPTNGATLTPGGSAEVTITTTGTRASQMRVSVSDSEGYFSVPTLLRVTPGAPDVPPGSTPFQFTVGISAAQNAPAGNYTVAVTVTEAGVQETVFLFVTVS